MVGWLFGTLRVTALAHPHLTDAVFVFFLQDPSLTVAEFMAMNPVLTEIEARIKHYQVVSGHRRSLNHSAVRLSRALDLRPQT